jgi:flagellin-specific chaperone FliS
MAMVQEVIDTLTPLYEGWKEIIPSKPAIKLLQDLPN